MNTVTTEKKRKSSSKSPPPTSFSSLPYDVTLNVLARIPRIHHLSLSLVSKSFRSLLASRELDATRTLIGKTENYIYLCLNFPQKNPKLRWFVLAPTPKQQKLIPIPSFPYEHPESPTVVSIGSEIYLIGGFVNEKRSRRVFLLDCRSHQWRILPEMRIPRGKSAAGLIYGKIYVVGGCSVGDNWREIYDPKTQTWEPKSLDIDRLWVKICVVVEEKILCAHFCESTPLSCLIWCDLEEFKGWRMVKGLPISPDFISVANPGGGRRLTVLWTLDKKDEEDGVIEIWCAEISFERRSREELYGIVEWSKILHTFDGSDSVSLLSSATVTH